MAEIVEFSSEETIPELEHILNVLFDKEHVETIVNLRKEHQNKLHKASKRKEDYLNYIKFEIRLLRAIRLKHKQKPTLRISKLTSLEFSLGNRINKMFVQTIRSFPRELAIWMMYLKFCKQMKYFVPGSRVWQQLLEVHGEYKAELFKQAAAWELEECGSVEKARKYLLMGIHVHKDNKMLLSEAFRLELYDAEKKRKELTESNQEMDTSNPHSSAKKAELIYDYSIKKLNDVDLLNDLLNICSQYDFTGKLINKITQDLKENETDERAFDILARRKLKNELSDVKISPKTKIFECVMEYDKAVKKLNTPRMWVYYLDTMQELEKDNAVLPNYKRKLLLTALQKGAAAGKLSEKHYLLWVSKLQGPEKHKKLVGVLQGAVKKLPESCTLWHMLLRVHLMKGEEKQANKVFEKGVAALTTHSLPLWKLMLQFEQTKRNNKVEDIFKKGCEQSCPEIAGPLQPMYLEWLVLTQGIAMARKTYDQMCNLSFVSLEMHKKMVYLEKIQPNLHMKRIRKTYTVATAQYGFDNVDVWIDHCKFEMANGGAERVNDIYWRARKNLSPLLFETFYSEFNLIKNIPLFEV